jgi:hypothetical protein
MRDQNTPLMPWPFVLALFSLNLVIAALPFGMIYLDPSDNLVTPFISDADVIIAKSSNLTVCALFFWLPLPFCLLTARLNPFQKLPRRRADRHWRNWKWALHRITQLTVMACLGGVLSVGLTGTLLQPAVMKARGYELCWQVKRPSTFRARDQGYVRRGMTCPEKPSLDE